MCELMQTKHDIFIVSRTEHIPPDEPNRFLAFIAFNSQLNHFWKKLVTDQVYFSACGICRIDRKMLTSVNKIFIEMKKMKWQFPLVLILDCRHSNDVLGDFTAISAIIWHEWVHTCDPVATFQPMLWSQQTQNDAPTVQSSTKAALKCV